MANTAPQKIGRPKIFWELTRSICPLCRQVIDAHIPFRDGRMIPFCAYNNVGYREQVMRTLMPAAQIRI